MDLEVGSILTGKVTGITKFGAFVTVAPGKSGLVHISEIANTYVNDIHDHLTEGQEVNVKVISIEPNGRVNLSIKATLPPPPPRQGKPGGFRDKKPYQPRGQAPRQSSGHGSGTPAPRQAVPAPKEPEGERDTAFDDMLKRFMQDSDSKISASGLYNEKKSRRRGR